MNIHCRDQRIEIIASLTAGRQHCGTSRLVAVTRQAADEPALQAGNGAASRRARSSALEAVRFLGAMVLGRCYGSVLAGDKSAPCPAPPGPPGCPAAR
jgi:hypothetical protein